MNNSMYNSLSHNVQDTPEVYTNKSAEVKIAALSQLDSSFKNLPVTQTGSDMFEVGYRFPSARGQEELQGYGAITYGQGLSRKLYKGHFEDGILQSGSFEIATGDYREGQFSEGNRLHGIGKHIIASPVNGNYENWERTHEESGYFQKDSLIIGYRKNLKTGEIENIDHRNKLKKVDKILFSLEKIKHGLSAIKSENVFELFRDIQHQSDIISSENPEVFEEGMVHTLEAKLLEVQKTVLNIRYSSKSDEYERMFLKETLEGCSNIINILHGKEI